MILTPDDYAGPVWGAGFLTAPAVDLPSDLYADDVIAALEGETGAALDVDDFFAPHEDDVLALPFFVPLDHGRRWYGRLSQHAGHVCDRAKLTPLCEWAFLDLDPADGTPWGDLPDPGAVPWPSWVWAAYTTPKGLRVVVRTDTPFPATQYHNVVAWCSAQLGGSVSLGGRVLEADPSADQWNRLQRLPHATRRDGKYPALDGKPLPSRIYRGGTHV